MIKFFSFAMAFLCSSFHAQQQIQVLDAETQKPVPYAKLILKGKDYYKNTEENGQITLGKDEVISEIQSFGYENLQVDKYQSDYLLKQKVVEIEEIVISKPIFLNSVILGNLDTYGTSSGGFNVLKPYFFGKVIEFENTSQKPLFVKNIKFKTVSRKKNVSIRILIYDNNNGLPGQLICDEEIICEKGYNRTQNYNPKPFLFPKGGIIVGFQWILNETNKYESEMKMMNSNDTKKIICYAPEIAGSKKDLGYFVVGALVDGNWKFNNNRIVDGSKFSYNLALQVELTN